MAADGLTQIEIERLQRMERNARRMAETVGSMDQYALLQEQPRAPPRRYRAPRARFHVPEEDRRRSGRIQNQPAPEYNLDNADPSLRDPADRPAPSRGRRRCRRRDDDDDDNDDEGREARRARPGAPNAVGWVRELGEASDAAAAAARAAAEALAARLRAEGRLAYAKSMSPSQVTPGFWANLPRPLADAYPYSDRADIELVSDDVPVLMDGTTPEFWHLKDSRANAWYAVFLRRPDGGAGLSGGWAGFAKDQMLFPNDWVVFVRESDLLMTAHLFRASDYETDATRARGMQATSLSLRGIRPSATLAASLAAAAPSGSGSASAAAPAGAAARAGSEGPDASAASPAAAPRARGGAATPPPPPPALSSDTSSGGADISDDISGASGDAGGSSGDDQEAASDGGDAESGGGSDSDGDSGSLSDSGNGGAAALTPGAKAPARSARARINAVRLRAPAAGAARAPRAARDAPPRRGARDQEPPASRAARGAAAAKKAPAAAAAAATTAATAAAAAGRPARGDAPGFPGATPEQQREADRAWAAGREVSVQPAGPLPAKTPEEQWREEHDKQFWVRCIKGHRLNRKTRQREYLVHWWYFSDTWNTWEPRESLTGAPASYKWALPMPAAVKSIK